MNIINYINDTGFQLTATEKKMASSERLNDALVLGNNGGLKTSLLFFLFSIGSEFYHKGGDS